MRLIYATIAGTVCDQIKLQSQKIHPIVCAAYLVSIYLTVYSPPVNILRCVCIKTYKWIKNKRKLKQFPFVCSCAQSVFCYATMGPLKRMAVCILKYHRNVFVSVCVCERASTDACAKEKQTNFKKTTTTSTICFWIIKCF